MDNLRVRALLKAFEGKSLAEFIKFYEESAVARDVADNVEFWQRIIAQCVNQQVVDQRIYDLNDVEDWYEFAVGLARGDIYEYVIPVLLDVVNAYPIYGNGFSLSKFNYQEQIDRYIRAAYGTESLYDIKIRAPGLPLDTVKVVVVNINFGDLEESEFFGDFRDATQWLVDHVNAYMIDNNMTFGSSTYVQNNDDWQRELRFNLEEQVDLDTFDTLTLITHDLQAKTVFPDIGYVTVYNELDPGVLGGLKQ
jgi:hypothetical protein